jgi:hypothetical protein
MEVQLSHCPWQQESTFSPPKSNKARFPNKWRKAITCYSAGGTRSPVPPRHTEAQHFMPHLPAEETKSWNPNSSIEWQSATLLVVGGLPLHSAQGPRTPHCDCRGAPVLPSKTGNSSPLTEERKKVISTTTRTLQGVTYPAYPSLGNTAGAPGEKISKPQLQRHRN